MKYQVRYIREQGLEAKWSRCRNGAPIILAREPGSSDENWYAITDCIWERAKTTGLKKAFQEATVFGRFFSIAI